MTHLLDPSALLAHYLTHRKDAVYPATIVGIPPMEDSYIVGLTPSLP